MTGAPVIEIPGAPLYRLDCCDAQEFHISRRGAICFEKVPAVRHTPDAESVIGKCRFCENTIVVELDKRSQTWTVHSAAPV
jgi:hypothetical protein